MFNITMRTELIREGKKGKVTYYIYKCSIGNEFNYSLRQVVLNKLGLVEIGHNVFDTKRQLNTYLKKGGFNNE